MKIYKILAIEPDPLFQNYLKELLTENFELDCVTSLAETKEYIENSPVHCVLLTDHVPDSDILSIIGFLKEKDIPSVMVSGSSDDKVGIEATKHGVLDYHTKESISPRSMQSSLHYAIELHEARQREAQRQADLSAFVQTAAHDLSSPLMVINGQAELLKMGLDEKESPETLDIYANEIQNTTLGLLDFINKLLEHTKSAKEIEKEPLDLSAILDQVTKLLGTLMEETKASVEYDGEVWPKVLGDPIWITQLLQNLLGNAMKYSRPGLAPTVKIEVETDLEQGVHIIHVQDNGLGIPKEFHKKIFRPLERGPLREQSGFGIGLATCQRIVERHSGKIWVESEENNGSRFSFTLPMDV